MVYIYYILTHNNSCVACVVLQVGDNALNAMLRAALAKEVALWRSQFGAYIAFTRNDFNQCFAAAFARVQVWRSLFTHSHSHHSHEHTLTCACNTDIDTHA